MKMGDRNVILGVFFSSVLPIELVQTDFSILDITWMRILRLFLHFS